MNYAAIIKQVGRGRDGARPVSHDEAAALFGAMLDGRVPEMHLGALLLAYRIKGESREELAGFLDALHARVPRLPYIGPVATVVIPSYNGARTMPNLVPLLALALARRGVPVLVHGVTDDPGRVTSAEIFAALAVAPVRDAVAAADALAARNLAFMSVDALAPGLAALLSLRRTLGVRNSAHTVAKMFAPVENGLLLASATHPEYLEAMRDFYTAHPADVLLMRGTQGEAVANARRAQAIEWLHGGRAETVVEAESGTLLALPALPALDAHATAAWTRAVLDGATAMPGPVARQVEVIERIAKRRPLRRVHAA
jgi:anthranilate phosphoribosyltransferase